MGAPTWPPTPEQFYKEQMESEGLSAVALGLESEEDEEAERALLAHFLYNGPRRLDAEGRAIGTPLNVLTRRLEGWLRLITGRAFTIGFSDPPSTDGANLFLPRAVPAPEEPWQDELLYRMMGLTQLGLVEFGFLQQRSLLGEIYKDWVLRSCYHLLAARWVISRWAADYPGIAKDLAVLVAMEKAGSLRVNVTTVPRDGLPPAFTPLYDGLTINLNWAAHATDPAAAPARAAVAAVDAAPTAGAARAVALGQAQILRQHYRRLRLGPPPVPYHLGILRPEWMLGDLARAADHAAENDWRKGQLPLRQLLQAKARQAVEGAGVAPAPSPTPELPRPGLRDRLRRTARDLLKGTGPELRDLPAYGPLRDEARHRAAEPSGERRWQEGARPDELLATDDAPRPDQDDGREHDEWDYKGGHYRLGETRVLCPEAPGGPLSSYERAATALRKEIKEVRRKFEALRVEERWLGGQRDGPEIDLNRAVLALTDIAGGQQPREDFYRRFVRRREPLCVLTLVDLSGSTQGHVIHLEQDAVVLFAEGLKTLDIPHAFYGFNGNHPRECNLYRLKGFDEGYTEDVLKRLANLRPAGGSRLGAYIRHATWILQQQRQPRRVLMVLSDGRPEDRGEYRGAYGVKDTAMAVQEAVRAGVYIHCISMDPGDGAEEYLQDIFAERHLLLKDVDSLPRRLPEVFRDLVK